MSRSRKELWFKLPSRMEFVDITPGVDACLPERGVCEGLCLVKTKYSIFLRGSFPSNQLVKFARASPLENLNPS